ncbi:MAG: class I SAM-dependent methyltransferase [Armatimonadetes bacterium]|nr:class I SAM-dependent methyltransferase [Armatimonadota bacterium]
MTRVKREQGLWWRDFFGSEDSIPLSFFPTDEDTEAEVEGLMDLAALRPGMRVADICCGAGRHAVRLARRGLQVIGLDASEMMLQRARQAALDVQGCGFVQGDAAALPFASESFDVALNLFNSFGYFEDDELNQRTLEETARCLRPGGRFILETRNSTYQILYAPYHLEVKRADGSPAIIRCRYDCDSRRLHSTWSAPEGEVLYRAAIRLYGVEELREMFARAGMTVERVCSAYDGTGFEGWERVLILVAHRN